MSAEMQTCPSCGELVPNEYILCVWCGMDLTAEKIRRSGVVIDNRAALIRMRRVVVDPLNTFKELSLLPDLRGGKITFYLIGVMMTFNIITILSKLQGLDFNTEFEETIFLQLTTTIGITSKFLINLILIVVQPLVFFAIFMVIWKFSSRIMSLLSRSLGGRGDREKIRAVVGYSMVPVLISWTLAWLIRLITPPVTVTAENQAALDQARAQIDAGVNTTVPPGEFTYESIQEAVVQFSETGFGVVGLVFIYIGWIWATVLGIIGMKNVGKLSWFEAVIAAGVPYAIFISILL